MQIKIGRLRFRLLILPKIKEIWKVVEKLSCQQKCAAGGAGSSLRIGKKHKATTGIPGDLISKYFIAHPFNLYRVSFDYIHYTWSMIDNHAFPNQSANNMSITSIFPITKSVPVIILTVSFLSKHCFEKIAMHYTPGHVWEIHGCHFRLKNKTTQRDALFVEIVILRQISLKKIELNARLVLWVSLGMLIRLLMGPDQVMYWRFHSFCHLYQCKPYFH